jgi:hypothetical protein
VILGVSFHSFSHFYDKYIHDAEKTEHMIPQYFSILDFQSIRDVNIIPTKQSINIFRNIVKSLFYSSTIHEYPFIGSFYKSERSNLNDSTINIVIQRHYFTEYGNEQDYSNYQLKYLKKIIKLCNRKHIDLVLINTPVNNAYFNKIPAKFITNYYSILQKLNFVQFYDFNSFKMDNNGFGDGDHLNLIGAKEFSVIIENKIRQEDEAKKHNTDYKTNGK